MTALSRLVFSSWPWLILIVLYLYHFTTTFLTTQQTLKEQLDSQQSSSQSFQSQKEQLVEQIQQIQAFVSATIESETEEHQKLKQIHESHVQEDDAFKRTVVEHLQALQEKAEELSLIQQNVQKKQVSETFMSDTQRRLNSLEQLFSQQRAVDSVTDQSHLRRREQPDSSAVSQGRSDYKPPDWCWFNGFSTPKEARFDSMKEYQEKAARESDPLNHQEREKFLTSHSKRQSNHPSFPVIEAVISLVSKKINDNVLGVLFQNCFPNTLDTTVRLYKPSIGEGKLSGQSPDRETILQTNGVQYIGRPYVRKPFTYIITGDIPAMWLRDSTNQVWPYLPFMKFDVVLEDLLIGVLNLQTKMVIRDPYANAFVLKSVSRSSNELFPFTIDVWEQKWELDSLASWLRLSAGIADHLHAAGVDPAFLFDADWQAALTTVLSVVRDQTDISKYKNTKYSWRHSNSSPFEILYLGQGFPANDSGLIKSAFRPSDDASYMAFPIAANAMFYQSLKTAMKYAEPLLPASVRAATTNLLQTLKTALDRHSVVFHRCFGTVYAFEVDGFGNHYTMDDANIPSVLALPYLGYTTLDDPIYSRTRELVLSEYNPFFYKGRAAQGIGSPHAWGPHWIWPLSIIIQAMTSDDRAEIKYCLDLLKTTHGNTFMMHESFHRDDGTRYTREWFAWANTIFGEMLVAVAQKYPELLFSNGVSPLTENEIRASLSTIPANYNYKASV